MAHEFQTHRPHPWHGLAPGPDVPEVLNAFIEITPFDPVKWEIDKETGYLKVDRPQLTNSLPPTLYGFVPQTYCGPRVADLAGAERGDGDPLDICVLSERPINRADVLLHARPVGGLLMLDHGEVRDISQVPEWVTNRLRHYFTTYKMTPGEVDPAVHVGEPYGRDRAVEVLNASLADYQEFVSAIG